MKIQTKFKIMLFIPIISIGLNALAMDHNENELVERLVSASGQGDIKFVQYLISEGVDVNKKTSKYHPGWTPLINAAGMNESEIVKILLAAGAQPNIVGNDGRTALLAAIRFPKMIQQLIKAKADVNQIPIMQSQEAFTPLMKAVLMALKNPNIVNILINAGANIYYINEKNDTALTYAGMEANSPIARALLAPITELPQEKKDSIKNWLLVAKKMQSMHGIIIPKDIRIHVANIIRHSYAQEMRDRVIHAGGSRAIERAIPNAEESYIDPDDLRDFIELIEQHMNLDFLTGLVRKQSWPNQVHYDNDEMEGTK